MAHGVVTDDYQWAINPCWHQEGRPVTQQVCLSHSCWPNSQLANVIGSVEEGHYTGILADVLSTF